MTLNKEVLPILNKSNLSILISLIFLIFTLLLIFNSLPSKPSTKAPIEAIVIPDSPNVGDTVQVKITKKENIKETPKVFFNKTKMPVFSLSSSFYRSLVPLSADFKAGGHDLEIFYGPDLKKIKLTINETKYPFQELTLSKEVAALKASRIEKAKVAKTLSIVSNEKLWNGKFIFPSNGRRSTVYGVKRRVNGVINPDYYHKGLDFAADTGSEIRAPENGKVILRGKQAGGFVVNGNCIFLDHGHGVISGYLHLSSILVKEGDFVKKGQLVGKVGSSGIASGPHLHWGIYVLGMTVDPVYWTSMIVE